MKSARRILYLSLIAVVWAERNRQSAEGGGKGPQRREDRWDSAVMRLLVAVPSPDLPTLSA